MRPTCGVAIVLLACLPALGSPTRAESPGPGGPDEVKNRFVGNWALLPDESSIEGPRAATGRGWAGGRIIYDERGHVAAQLMRAGRPKITPESTDAERLAASQGYIAYYGSFSTSRTTGNG